MDLMNKISTRLDFKMNEENKEEDKHDIVRPNVGVAELVGDLDT